MSNSRPSESTQVDESGSSEPSDGHDGVHGPLSRHPSQPTVLPAETPFSISPIPRVEVRWFADWMEERLRANDHKGHWDDCESEYLLRRLREEAVELEDELRRIPIDSNAVAREAADVANFALMVADNARSHPVDAEIHDLIEARAALPKSREPTDE